MHGDASAKPESKERKLSIQEELVMCLDEIVSNVLVDIGCISGYIVARKVSGGYGCVACHDYDRRVFQSNEWYSANGSYGNVFHIFLEYSGVKAYYKSLTSCLKLFRDIRNAPHFVILEVEGELQETSGYMSLSSEKHEAITCRKRRKIRDISLGEWVNSLRLPNVEKK